MTRWQIFKLLVKILFSRDCAAVWAKLFPVKEESSAPPSPQKSNYQYDPVSSRLMRR